MTKDTDLSDKEIKMRELCKVLENLKTQRDGARVNRINLDIAFTNLQSLIVATNADIARLEAAGTKRSTPDEIKEAIKEAQAQQIPQGPR